MSRRKHTGIIELPDGRCKIDYYTPDGKRHRPIIGSEKRAIAVLKQRKAEILLGKYQPPRLERRTFSEVLDEYLESQEGMLSVHTLDNYKLQAEILKPLLGHELIDRIDAHLLTRTLARIINERSVSGGTVNRYRALLSSVFNCAVTAKYIMANPINSKTVKKYPEPKGRKRHLGFDEERVLRNAIRAKRYCRDTYRELEVDLAMFTGLRKTEQYTALWSKVDLENKLMMVTGKSRGGIEERTIPLNSVAVDILKELHQVSNGSSYVIPVRKLSWGRESRENKKDVRNWFKAAVKAAGIENFRWHDLRHTFASRAVMAGVPLATVKEWMGHKNIQTTMIYAHLSPGHHQVELQKIVDTRGSELRLVKGLGAKNDTSESAVNQIAEFKAVRK